MKNYSVKMEVAGDYALWTDPASGSAPVTYPTPIYSAVKNIFEAILFIKSAEVIPTKVEICKPIQLDTITCNSRGPWRKPSDIKDDNSGQIISTVLYDVCYRFYANIIQDTQFPCSTNSQHEYKDRFNKRIKKGQRYQTPFLGQRWCVPTYWGLFREETQVESTVNLTIPTMLKTVFPDGKYTKPRPVFWNKELVVVEGVLNYA